MCRVCRMCIASSTNQFNCYISPYFASKGISSPSPVQIIQNKKKEEEKKKRKEKKRHDRITLNAGIKQNPIHKMFIKDIERKKGKSSHMITGFPMLVHHRWSFIHWIRRSHFSIGNTTTTTTTDTSMHHGIGHRHHHVHRIVGIRNWCLRRDWRWHAHAYALMQVIPTVPRGPEWLRVMLLLRGRSAAIVTLAEAGHIAA